MDLRYLDMVGQVNDSYISELEALEALEGDVERPDLLIAVVDATGAVHDALLAQAISRLVTSPLCSTEALATIALGMLGPRCEERWQTQIVKRSLQDSTKCGSVLVALAKSWHGDAAGLAQAVDAACNGLYS